MFTLLSCKNSTKFTQLQRNRLIHLIELFEATPEGSWLKDFDWRSFQFYWCPAMTVDNGIMGCYTPLFGDKVFLMQNELQASDNKARVQSSDTYWVDLLFSTTVHELRHAWQRRHFGPVLYMVLAIPLIRELTIEPDARKQGGGNDQNGTADKWIQQNGVRV